MPSALRALHDGDSDDDEVNTNEVTSSTWVRFQAACQRLVIYLKFTSNEIKKRKCSYCLGCSSCCLVVFIVAVLVSTLNNVPAVFLRLAEGEEGEADLKISPLTDVGYSLSYPKITETLRSVSIHTPAFFSYHAPRFVITSNTRAFNFAQCQIPDVWKQRTASNDYDMKWTYVGVNGKPNECAGGAGTAFPVRDLCLSHYCGTSSQYILYGVDTDKETKMGYGRDWKYGKIPEGQVIIDKTLANNLQLKKGDTIVLTLSLGSELREVIQQAGLGYRQYVQGTPAYFLHDVHVPFTVWEVISEMGGKFSSSASNIAIVEYTALLKVVARHMHPSTPAQAQNVINSFDPYEVATTVAFNLPPPRFDFYNTNSYDVIQRNVLSFAGEIMYRVGFTRVSTSLPLLEFMRDSRMFSLFLGLIISIIITVLTILSIILIYSLLMINVETRTFELGVLRMVGMNRNHLIHLIIVQALIYAIPAWVAGLLVAQGAEFGIAQFLEKQLLVQLPKALHGGAVGLATVLGLLIPLIAAVFPIQNALSQQLTDSLDTRHSKAKAVEYKIERSEDNQIQWSVVGIGAFMFVFGFLIYYLFPLALLSFNVLLLFYMFFGLLMCMLLGLVLLSLNVETIIEHALTTVFFFLENAAIRTLILKNLIAHRRRNRKTTIMYALSLGFIIWISISFNLQVSTYRYRTMRRYGTELSVDDTNDGGGISVETATSIESALGSIPQVQDWAWISKPVVDDKTITQTQISTFGRYRQGNLRIVAVSPNFLSIADNQFLNIEDERDSGLTLSEQLYTQHGSASLPLGTAYKSYMNLQTLESPYTLITLTTNTSGSLVTLRHYEVMRPLAFLNACPSLTFSKFPSDVNQGSMTSVPSFLRLKLYNITTVRSILWDRLLLKTPSFLSSEDKEKVKFAVMQAVLATGYSPDNFAIRDLQEVLKPVEKAADLINTFFLVTTLFAMVMCFFSLMSSMLTNIMEQSKEIGILRALGLRRFPVKRIYVWEAFILVMSASVMGFVIGTAVSWTMGIQRVLFTQLPLPFEFPVRLFVAVVVCAFVCAVVSAYFPTRQLIALPPVHILRRMLT